MALFTERQIRARFSKERAIREVQTFSAEDVLTEERNAYSTKEYDIFLSHSSKDIELIAGLKLLLNDLGYSVYVDWNDDKLDQNDVTPYTAKVLRERMKQCKSLVYAFTENASNSKWMPWELGYFDALKNSRVAVLPITKTSKCIYDGSEFVGLYYFIQIDKSRETGNETIWVHNGNDYVVFDGWLRGQNPYRHT